MDEMVEVVEEEVAVDDQHLRYGEFYENEQGDYEEFEVDEAEAEELDRLDVSIVKIKPELINPDLRKFRVPVTDITDELFAAFCEKVVNSGHKITPPRLNDALDSIYHSGDWAVGQYLPVPCLGTLERVMVHLPTSKLLIKSDERKRLLTEAMVKHQNERNPVGTALQEMQNTFLGLPPIGQLRNLLSVELRKVFPLVQPPTAVPHPTNRRLEKRVSGWKMGSGPKKKKVAVEKPKEREADGEFRNPPPISPIDDNIYEDLAEVIASSGQRQSVMGYDFPMPIKALLAKGCLVAEQVNHHNADLEEIIRAGWLIRERTTGRIVPRSTDVNRIWTRIRERMIRKNLLAQIIAYVDAKFVGIITNEHRRLSRSEDVYKGTRVVFPQQPAVIGRRPMQYVQIDILDPPYDEYQSEEIESALLVVDLHSQFAFCKPILSDSSPDEVLRFLLESFASFGPPEAYVVGNETKNWEYVQQTMNEVESTYKVNIKCVGFAKEHECGKAISAEGVRKAGGDGEFRWIDTLHNSVVEWNQRPGKIFNYALSPFEVMFGREAWRGCSSARRVPPWIEEREEREGEKTEGEQPLPPLSVRIPNVIRRLSAPDATFLDLKLLDPGTGMHFEIGDRVYVRNMHYMESSEPSTSKKRDGCRYLRGVVAQKDESHPEFLYRVNFVPEFVDQDALSYEAWPSLQNDTNEELDSSWFSPWDLAPSNFDLQCRRTTNPPKDESAPRCSCELSYCDLLVDEECARGMSAICCTRRREGPCAAHQTVKRRCGRKKKEEETEQARVSKPVAEGGEDARYIFKDGSLVRINRVAKTEMPEEILQQ